MYQVVRHLCINLAIPPPDRIVLGRVLKQFLRGGLEPLGSKQENAVLDTAVHDALLERKVESAENPQHLLTMLLGTLLDLVITSYPSSKLQIFDGSICHTRHKGSRGLKDKPSVLCKFMCPTSSSKCCNQEAKIPVRPGPLLRHNG